jgi:hypothetical protein
MQRLHAGLLRSHLTLALPQSSQEDRSFAALGAGFGSMISVGVTDTAHCDKRIAETSDS